MNGRRNDVAGFPQELTAEMLREMDASGLVEIGGHTAGHSTLVKIPVDGAKREIETNKSWIEGLLGHGIESFAYPRGGENDGIVALVKAAGYKYAASMKKKMRPPAEDFFRASVKPEAMSPGMTAQTLMPKGRTSFCSAST